MLKVRYNPQLAGRNSMLLTKKTGKSIGGNLMFRALILAILFAGLSQTAAAENPVSFEWSKDKFDAKAVAAIVAEAKKQAKLSA